MYALITRDLSTIKKEVASVTPIDPAQLDPAKPYWVPINNITNDISTGSDAVREGPVQTIFADRVERVTTIRDMTAQEIDAQNTAQTNSKIDASDRATHRIIFQLVNDVRTLKGQGTITVQQYKDYYKSLL